MTAGAARTIITVVHSNAGTAEPIMTVLDAESAAAIITVLEGCAGAAATTMTVFGGDAGVEEIVR